MCRVELPITAVLPTGVQRARKRKTPPGGRGEVMVPNEELFRRTFRDSPIGMTIMDEVGTYVEVNEAFARMLGYEASELRGRHFAEFTHSDDLPRNVEQIGQIVSGEVPHFQAQKRYLHRGGDVIWARVTVTDVDVQGQGSEHFFVGQVEDITEIR